MNLRSCAHAAGLLIIGTSTAQVTYERKYGIGENVDLRDAHVTMDGILLVGRSYSADWPAFLVKTNFAGDTMWTRRYDGTLAWTAPPTTDGGHILAGDAVVKLNASGTPQWAKAYNGNGAYSIQQTFDGGYIFGGWSSGPSIIKTNYLGNPIWQQSFNNLYELNCVRQTSDGGYAVLGSTITVGAGVADMLLIRTDAVGEVLWSRTYGGPAAEDGWALQQTADGGFMLVGGTQSFGAGATDVLVVRTDANGDTTWCRTYGGALGEAGHALHLLGNGQALVSGPTQSWGNGVQLYGLFIDANGDLLWSNAYGDGGSVSAVAIRRLNDGGSIVAGTTNSQDHFLLAKTDVQGNTDCSSPTATIVGTPVVTVTQPTVTTSASIPVETNVTINTLRGGLLGNNCLPTHTGPAPKADNELHVAPNPTTCGVRIMARCSTGATLQVYTVLGGLVHQRTLPTTTNPWVDLSSLAKGVYILQLATSDTALPRQQRIIIE